MTGQHVYLHVGLPKTGTTGLQDRFWRNRDEALRRGVFYPGEVVSSHFHAAVHLQPERYLDWVDPAHAGTWGRMVDQVKAWPATSLISHELFASATPAEAARARADLAFAQTHIVVTARDLGRQIPSVWQENVKNQHTTAFDDFLHMVDDPAPELRNPFWEFQDLPRILATWAGDLPPDRVHVVTVPPSGGGRDELWRRYLSVVGLTPEQMTRTVPSDNSALSVGQIELLRRLNQRLQPERIEWARYEAAVKHYLIGEVMFAAADRGAPTLPASALPAVTERAQAAVAYIRERGFHVVGDLDDLIPRPPREPRPVPGTERLLDLTLDTLADVVLTMPLPTPSRSVADRVKPLLRRGYRRFDATRRHIDSARRRMERS